MALHDAYARRTPYELALPSPEYAQERFPTVVEEAESQGFPGHLTDIGAFSLLGEVGAILQEIRVPDDPPEMIHQYGFLLFHAFHFWKHECPLYLVTVDAAREMVGGGGVGEVPLPDIGAAYLQLPQHLFWVAGDSAPESLDGIFVSWVEGRLTAMAVAGVATHRPGVITMALPVVPVADLAAISTQEMRDDGADFSTTMPGAEIDGLYAVESAGEILKLVARLLPRLEGAAWGESTPDASDPPPSSLDYRVIRPSG